MTKCECLTALIDKAVSTAVLLRAAGEYDLSRFWKNVSEAWRKKMLGMTLGECMEVI